MLIVKCSLKNKNKCLQQFVLCFACRLSAFMYVKAENKFSLNSKEVFLIKQSCVTMSERVCVLVQDPEPPVRLHV